MLLSAHHVASRNAEFKDTMLVRGDSHSIKWPHVLKSAQCACTNTHTASFIPLATCAHCTAPKMGNISIGGGFSMSWNTIVCDAHCSGAHVCILRDWFHIACGPVADGSIWPAPGPGSSSSADIWCLTLHHRHQQNRISSPPILALECFGNLIFFYLTRQNKLCEVVIILVREVAWFPFLQCDPFLPPKGKPAPTESDEYFYFFQIGPPPP